jgi:tRNA 2-thiouridine synthesizing protein A
LGDESEFATKQQLMSDQIRDETGVLDLRGLICPLPVLKTRKALAAMAPGTRVWVETTDPLAAIDLPNYCQESGNRLIGTRRAPDCQRFLIERA